jgi:hypothetical protein
MKPKLKPPGTIRLKLQCDMLLSTSAFKFNLRRYIKEGADVLLADKKKKTALFCAAGPGLSTTKCVKPLRHLATSSTKSSKWCVMIG